MRRDWDTLSKTEKWMLGVFFLAFIPCLWVYSQKMDRSLYRNPEFTHAVIFKLTERNSPYARYKRHGSVYYRYSVDGINYEKAGRRNVNMDKIGDPVVVVYDKTNPANCKLCRDSKYSLNCHMVRKRN